MARGFRGRLTVTVIGLIGLSAALVAASSYVVVRTSLRNQLVDDAVTRAEFNVTVLAGPEQLALDADRAEFETSGLADRFLLRGSGGVYVEFDDGDEFSSSLPLLQAGDLLSDQLRAIVARGEYGYEFLTVGDEPTVVVGARRPPGGPDFYFFYSAAETDAALTAIGRVLAFAVAGVVVLGVIGARLVSRQVLLPVERTRLAAAEMAAGDLSVRLTAESDDELGGLAESFNQMASALESRIAELVAARERERRFVSDVSHELRTPITALVNEAARLSATLDAMSGSDRRVGALLVADVQRLRSLIEDLLEISRLESAPAEVEAAEVDLRRFLEAVAAERHPAAGIDVDDSASFLAVDRRSLERIIGNLLDNVREHAPGAGVRITAQVTDGRLMVEVADEGPGVEAAMLPQLFDRFFKGDPSRQGGSGLGLAIARRHAQRLGGDLAARNREPHGLVFRLEVPVTELLPGGGDGVTADPDAEGEATIPHRRQP